MFAWLLATQRRFLLGLLLLTVTEQRLQLVSVVGETTIVPPGASDCTDGAASAAVERRASKGTQIARAAKATNSSRREALRGGIA